MSNASVMYNYGPADGVPIGAPFWLTDMGCMGNESSIAACPRGMAWGDGRCYNDHKNRDASIVCDQTPQGTYLA
jgi:hypothetical protein